MKRVFYLVVISMFLMENVSAQWSNTNQGLLSTLDNVTLGYHGTGGNGQPDLEIYDKGATSSGYPIIRLRDYSGGSQPKQHYLDLSFKEGVLSFDIAEISEVSSTSPVFATTTKVAELNGGTFSASKFVEISDTYFFLDPNNSTTSMRVGGDIIISQKDETYSRLLFNDYQAQTSQFAEIRYDCASNVFSFYNASSTPRMIINKSGDVGIGTTAPTSKLEINGATENIEISNTSETPAGILFYDHGYETSQYAKILFDCGSNDLDFYVNSATPKLTITPGGGVGIGTTNPGSYKLAVNGNINCKELVVTSDVPESDYVFEEDYDLSTLEEVESFIKENKHLPEVPSAADFKENGYSVGTMDDILLRKVEELTLYMIELKKENANIQDQLNELKK